MINTVTFPGLGLEFQLDRVALVVLGHPIYWYGIIIALGVVLAVAVCCRLAPRLGIVPDHLLDLVLVAVPLGVVGARLYYILFYLDLYRTPAGGLDFLAMLRVWDGGLAIYGGIIVSALATVIFCRVRRVKFAAYADIGAIGLLIGQAVGRWGNFFNAEAYGGETALPWRMGVNGVEVHPTFLYESLWNLLGLALLLVILFRFRRFDGQLFLTYVLWYGLGRAWIEGLRADSLYLFGLRLFGAPIRVSQLVAALSALAALGCLIYHLGVRRHTPEELYVNQMSEKERETHDDSGR